MTGELVKVNILATRLIANVSDALARQLGLREGVRSIGLISTDCDDATYCALDEATKKAAVEVVYAKSLYAGADNATTRLAGEVIGVLGGGNPSEVESGLRAAVAFLEGGVGFRKANEDGSVVYFNQVIARSGSYLAPLAGCEEGQALAYLIAPPLEAMYGLDAALKAADVRLGALYAPPSETNFGGGLLAGSQSACRAAALAFEEAVRAVAQAPREEETGR